MPDVRAIAAAFCEEKISGEGIWQVADGGFENSAARHGWDGAFACVGEIGRWDAIFIPRAVAIGQAANGSVFDFGDGIGVGIVDFSAGTKQADRVAAVAEQDVGLESVIDNTLTRFQDDTRQAKWS